MGYIQGEDRMQEQLLPARMEDYVSENAPVRFIDQFVDQLDMKEMGFARSEAARTGRPGYNPRDLLKLYIYGYLNRVRSSRRLEAESARNVELMWLLGGLRPDFKTIADFRKDHREACRSLFKQFNLLCRRLELFGAELVAIDGAKFKALNNRQRHYTASKLQELETQVQARITEYLSALDTADEETADLPAAPSREALQQKLQQLRERKERYTDYQQQLAQSGESELSLSDPDSRGQKRVGVGYNVQVAVDAKHHLIVVPEVVQSANDLGQLHPMAERAQAELQTDKLEVVADAGYHAADQIEQCEKAGLETYVPAPRGTAGQGPQGSAVYPKTDFTYDAKSNHYQCPAGQTLNYGYTGDPTGRSRDYYYNIPACAGCARKSECTTAAYRKLSRLSNEDAVERQAERNALHPQKIALRKTIVEHVFGTLRNNGHDRFLCKGLSAVRAELSLSALSYNLRRALNVVGTANLIAGLSQGA